MKLSDIDQNLNEAPVSLLKRAATKLKKHTPFAPGARAEAEGQDEMEAAARAVGIAFRKWLGSANLKSKNAIPHTDLLKFFNAVNMGKTAEEVIGNQPEVKKLEQGGTAQQDSPGTDFTDQANQSLDKQQKKPNEVNYGSFSVNSKGAMESLEARLAKMLNEATVDQTDAANPVVTFNKKEAEAIILDVVGKIYKDNPEGLDSWLQAKGVRQETPNVADQTTTVSDEDFELIRDRIDQLISDVMQAPDRVRMDPEKKKQLLKLIDQLGDDAINDLA